VSFEFRARSDDTAQKNQKYLINVPLEFYFPSIFGPGGSIPYPGCHLPSFLRICHRVSCLKKYPLSGYFNWVLAVEIGNSKLERDVKLEDSLNYINFRHAMPFVPCC
jgi:hypothetical protein